MNKCTSSKLQVHFKKTSSWHKVDLWFDVEFTLHLHLKIRALLLLVPQILCLVVYGFKEQTAKLFFTFYQPLNEFTCAHSCMASLHSTPEVFVLSLKHFDPNLFQPASHSASRTVTTPSPPHFCPVLPGQSLLHLPESTLIKYIGVCLVSLTFLCLPDPWGGYLSQYHQDNCSQHPCINKM